MSSTSKHAQRGGPTDPVHDEELRRGIIHTQITRSTAWALVAAFLAVIYVPPVIQVVIDKVNDDETVLLDLFRRAPTRENLKQLEDDLDNTSYLRGWVQPRLQQQLSRLGRAGNKKAVIGRGRQNHSPWLYYQPGIAYLSGPAFLDPDTINSRTRAARMEAGAELHPDPRPAVLAFASALGARGVKLVLLPVPDKAMLQPAELHGRWPSDRPAAPPRNPDFLRFMGEMQAAGVAVFDATPADLKPGEPPRFLVQDTHWTPAFMSQTAQQLAAFVKERAALPAVADPGFTTATEEVTRVGDIVDMLKLPDEQKLFPALTITITKVLNKDGSPFQPLATADVLLLGDSFTNIFTQPAMGWGEAAGLGPHLARALGRPIDIIAQNDAGAFATRQLLARELSAGEDRLAGKKVVIWQFAVRELGVGDWKPIDWTATTREGAK
jgi:hypothetical protein